MLALDQRLEGQNRAQHLDDDAALVKVELCEPPEGIAAIDEALGDGQPSTRACRSDLIHAFASLSARSAAPLSR
jgi:hypothetical protein